MGADTGPSAAKPGAALCNLDTEMQKKLGEQPSDVIGVRIHGLAEADIGGLAPGAGGPSAKGRHRGEREHAGYRAAASGQHPGAVRVALSRNGQRRVPPALCGRIGHLGACTGWSRLPSHIAVRGVGTRVAAAQLASTDCTGLARRSDALSPESLT